MPAYVNYLGREIGLINHAAGKSKAKPVEAEAFHEGWRVVGVSAKALEDARDNHKRTAPERPFDEAAWLMNAKATPLRSKPYCVEAAARECAALAERAGWLRVLIVEIRRGEAPKRAALMPKQTMKRKD